MAKITISKIKAFGAEYDVIEWAELLKMDTIDVIYYTREKGLTIEDLCKIRGMTPKVKKTERKPRTSTQMVKTQERIALLLEYSGYINRNDVEQIEIRRIGTHTQHQVNFRGKTIGLYNYKTGVLSLSNGEGISLWDFDFEDAKICLGSDGFWALHPDTKRLLIDSGVKPVDDNELEEFYLRQTQIAEQNKSEPITYEGFGKEHTCAEWARVLGVPHNTLWRHLQRGQSIEEFAKERR